MRDLAELELHRARIWRLCYRMTGVAADADELVQDTFVTALESSPADATRELLPWLVTVATNKSRDLLRKRKTRAYVGPWLPAPIEDRGDEPDVAPDARYGQAESLSYAFLIALEALTPTQRACVILRDVLGYSVHEAAAALAISEANLKTSHHRARAALDHYEQGKARREVSLEEAQRAMVRFLSLISSGEVERVASLLAEDVRALNDGAGEFLAALNPLVSRDRVARFFRGVTHGVQLLGVELMVCGGLPAAKVRVSGQAPRAASLSVNLFDVNPSGEIATIYSIVATRKLAHLGP
ncbi:MAG TPA: sigma-70 family RNA polymerase sigma factor [Polyangiales bacterium]